MIPEECAGCRRWDINEEGCIFGKPPSVKETKYQPILNCPCSDCFVRVVCVDLCHEFVHSFNVHWDKSLLKVELSKLQKTESMRLEELLEKVEWLKITYKGDTQFVCPCCGVKYYVGQYKPHADTCELYTFLVALKAGVFQVMLRT